MPLIGVAALVGFRCPLPIAAASLLGSVRLLTLGMLWFPQAAPDVELSAFYLVVCGVLPWLLSAAVDARRRSTANFKETLSAREELRRREIASARMRERALLAEELHDDLGHALSLVALDLGRWELDPNLDEERRTAIGRSREKISHAVQRLGASVEALRDGRPPELAPPPGIQGLIAESRHSGVDITIDNMPDDEALRAFDRTTIVRNLREGITNAVKHAAGEQIQVRFAILDDARMHVEIQNRAPSTQRNPIRVGTGLVALQERVRMAGGELRAIHNTNGFTLSLRIPKTEVGSVNPHYVLAADDSGFEVEGGAGDILHQLDGGRRRSNRLLLLAFAVPAVALTLVFIGAQWFTYEGAQRSLLDSATFTALEIGSSERAVLDRLPSEEAEFSGERTDSCRFYSVTADPFADASGDLYRLCFEEGLLPSKDILKAGTR